MASEDWTANGSLSLLAREARRFSFFQLVRLLDRGCSPQARVGGTGSAFAERLRFRPDLSMAFPLSDVAAVEAIPPEEDRPSRIRITTGFLGLYGSTSPLPIFYTEEMFRRDADDDPVRHFVDLFQHRLIALFYRCWLKYRYPLQFEDEGRDIFSMRMFSFLGWGVAERAQREGLPAALLIRYAGLFTQKPRSAAALEGLISDVLGGLPSRVVQWAAQWVHIPLEQRIRLGQACGKLGADASLGEKVLSRTTRFRVVLGPMRYSLFVQLLPQERLFRMLQVMIGLFLTDPLEVDTELRVCGEEIPPTQLQFQENGGSRLGWTTWLATEPFGEGQVKSVVFEKAFGDRRFAETVLGGVRKGG